MIVSALLLVAGLIVRTDNRLSLLLFVLAYLPVSLPVMRSAWSEMRHGAWANEFTLMLLASIGAFAIGEYPEAVGVMLFYAVGEFFRNAPLSAHAPTFAPSSVCAPKRPH